MTKYRITAEIDAATFAEVKADPRFDVQATLEILENPYADCSTVWDFILAFCRENNRETFTRAEIVAIAIHERYSRHYLSVAEVDYQLRKMVYNLDIERVRHGHYDLGLGLYPEREAA